MQEYLAPNSSVMVITGRSHTLGLTKSDLLATEPPEKGPMRAKLAADIDRAIVSLPIKEIDCRHRRLEQDACPRAHGPRQGIAVDGGGPNQQVDDWGNPGPPQNLPQRRLFVDVRKRHGKRIAGDVNRDDGAAPRAHHINRQSIYHSAVDVSFASDHHRRQQARYRDARAQRME